MKKPNIYFIIVIMLLLAYSFSACVKNEENYATHANVAVKVRFDNSYISNTEIYDTPSRYATPELDFDYIVNFVAQNGRVVARRTGRMPDLVAGPNSFCANATLPFGKYSVEVWIAPSAKAEKGRLYETSDLRRVLVEADKEPRGDEADAFSATCSLDLRGYGNVGGVEILTQIEAVRANGKYMILATDVDEFLELLPQDSGDPYAVITFPGYFPIGYDVATSYATADDYKTGLTYRCEIEFLPDGLALMGYDYVFISPSDETVVFADIDIYSAAGVLLNTTNDVRIPIHRNTLSIIKGEFLTKDRSQGGIVVDDGFEGEELITLPD